MTQNDVWKCMLTVVLRCDSIGINQKWVEEEM